jgi:hypothetical protein
MIDKSRYTPQELMVFEAYGYRCVLCGFQYADALHEEPPRSLNPNWRDEPWKQFPLCNAHHEAIQDMTRGEAEEMLLSHEHIFAPGAIERIRNRNATVEHTE